MKETPPATTQPSPEELFALITAAVHTVLGARARVLHVSEHFHGTHAPVWAVEGRRDIFTSRGRR